MQKNLIVTPLSKAIAEAVEYRLETLGLTPTEFERALNSKVCLCTVRRIRKGTSGSILRNYEDVLDALGLELVVVPKSRPEKLKKHPDVTDSAKIIRKLQNQKKRI